MKLPSTRASLLTTACLAVSALALSARPAQAASGETRTSTAVRMPEEGGALPRAKMPEGGVGSELEHADAPQRVTAEDLAKKLHIGWDGYLKVIAEVIENDPAATFVGRNDGFRVGNARLGMAARYEKLLAYISLEASVAKTEDINQANAELTVGPRDMFLSYDLTKQVGITLGRFKAPYDIGELESEGSRVFIDRPLESRGVLPAQGYEQLGMSQGRQIGVMIAREKLGLSSDGFDLGYALALTNGNTGSLALNDNDRPAGFARLSLYWGPWVQLNLAGFTDSRTTGQLPNLFDQDVKGAEGSLVLKIGDLRIEGQVLLQSNEFPTTGAPSVTTLGFHAQWSYRLWGFEAAYRFAWYDPSDQLDIDIVTEHTLGLSHYVEAVPLRFTLNGTLAGEQSARELENNRVALLTQFNF